jgi:hypothetical protein
MTWVNRAGRSGPGAPGQRHEAATMAVPCRWITCC